MTGQNWVDVQIRASLDPGEPLDLLDVPAVQGSWEGNGTRHLYWTRPSWGSELLVSRVLTDQRQDFVQAYACAGIYSSEQREREGWTALEFRAAQGCEVT